VGSVCWFVVSSVVVDILLCASFGFSIGGFFLAFVVLRRVCLYCGGGGAGFRGACCGYFCM